MKIKREYRIAFFAIIVLAAFVLGINYLKGIDIFRKHRKFFAVYNQIGGLVEAAPISVNGLKIGNVSKIYFDQSKPGLIVVEMTVYNSLQIPSNSIARIFSPDIMGTKNIDIILGDSPVWAQNGDTLTSEMQASLSDEVNRQVAPLKKKAEDLMLSIDTLVTTVQAVFNSKARENLSLSFDHIRQTISTLEHTTFGIDTLVYGQRSRIERILFNIESISKNFRENDQKINTIITNFAAVSDSLAKSNIRQTFQNLNSSVTQLNEVAEKINKGEGTLGLLLNDKALYTNLEKSGKQLDQLLLDMKLNPGRYLNFSVFPPSKKRGSYSPQSTE